MAGELPAYTAWLRRLPCRRCGLGRVEIHHRRGAGMGLRAHDRDAMPLCHRCHMDIDLRCGPFRDWSKAALRDWEASQVARLRAHAPPTLLLEQDRATRKRTYRWPSRPMPRGRKIPSRPLRRPSTRKAR